MVKVTKKKITIVYIFIILLALLYILSFTLFNSNGQKKKYSQQIVFIHEADISNIDGFVIQTPQDSIMIKKSNNMWLVVQNENLDNPIPADIQKLKSLFLALADKKTISKAGSKSELTSYGLDSKNSSLILIYKNGSLYKTLQFGELDFSQTQRYFTDDELNSVFYFDISFDSFINSSAQSWCDPYIISSQLKDSVFNTGDIQSASVYDYVQSRGAALTTETQDWTTKISKLLELRHGGFVQKLQPDSQSNLLTKIHLETGNMAQIQIEIFAADSEEEYITKTTFISELTGQTFTYYTAISLWTYNKIKEIML